MTAQTIESALIDIKGVAALLGCSARHVEDLVREGKARFDNRDRRPEAAAMRPLKVLLRDAARESIGTRGSPSRCQRYPEVWSTGGLPLFGAAERQ